MYKITYEDRCVIEKRREEGWGCRKIAKALGLSKTAIFHELKSKSNQTGKYKQDKLLWPLPRHSNLQQSISAPISKLPEKDTLSLYHAMGAAKELSDNYTFLYFVIY